MTTTEGYSLWFMPSGEVKSRLAAIISKLSVRYGTPFFEPHVTIIGRIEGNEDEIIKKTEELASSLKPFSIKLTSLDHMDYYFRCLFAKVDKIENLMKASQKAREIFNKPGDPEYMPHLSLMYAEMSPDAKVNIIEELGKDLNITFEVKGIHLFKTTGEPKDWHRIKEFLLK